MLTLAILAGLGLILVGVLIWQHNHDEDRLDGRGRPVHKRK